MVNRRYLLAFPAALIAAAACTLSVAAASASATHAGAPARAATAGSANGIVGEWSNSAGKIVIAQSAKNTFTDTAVTPLKLMGGSKCSVPVGASQGTISGKGPTFTSSVTTYNPSDCSPAGVTSFTFQLSGKTLNESGEIWNRVPLAVATGSLATAKVGQAYSVTLQGAGDSYPYYVWKLAPGSAALPKGLSLGELSGTIAGKPTKKETVTIKVEISSLNIPSRPSPVGTATRSLKLTVS
jgi:uncharacterized protein (DUF2147 family)